MNLLQNVVSPEAENNNLQLKGLVHLEVNPVPDQLIHLIRQSHVVIVVQLIPQTDAQLINQLVSNATKWVIMPLCADLLITVTVLLRIQGNSIRFVGEVDHPGVGDLLQEDRSMKQLRSLKPSLMRNLT